MVVWRFRWPSNSWIVLISYPLSRRWVAKLCLSVCTEACFVIPAFQTAVLNALCSKEGWIWCLLTMLLLGSIESDFDGKSQNQPHSFPAFGYFLSKASGSQTPYIILSILVIDWSHFWKVLNQVIFKGLGRIALRFFPFYIFVKDMSIEKRWSLRPGFP